MIDLKGYDPHKCITCDVKRARKGGEKIRANLCVLFSRNATKQVDVERRVNKRGSQSRLHMF